MSDYPRILVVDDEKDTVTFIKVLLSKHNYEVITALSGEQALEILAEEPGIDAMLLDIMMPNMSGFDVLEKIRNEPQTADIKVIMLTALNQVQDKVRAFTEGASDYINKPFEAAELLARLETHIKLKKSEKALRENERRFQTVADFTYDWEYWISPEGQLIYTSPSCQRITGYSPSDLHANPELLEEMIHPEDKGKYPHACYSAKDQIQQVYEYDFRILRKDGSMRWIGHQCLPVYDENGQYLGRRGSNRDITKEKESEEAYFTLVEHSIQELLIFQDGKIVFANPAAAEMSDYSREELLAMTPEEILSHMHPEDRERFGKAILNRLEGKLAPARYEFRSQRKDGAMRWIEMLASYVQYHGKPAVQVVQVDITDHKMAEDAIRASEMLYRSTINAIDDIIHVVNKDLNITLYNTALTQWCQKIGTDGSNVMGKTIFEVFPFLPEHYVRAEYRQVFNTGKHLTSQETNPVGDQEIKTETRKIPIFEGKNVVRVVTIVHVLEQSE